MSFILQWIDVLWLVPAFVLIHPKERLLAAGFFIICMVMMRLQVELMGSIGYEQGILGVMSMPVFSRGLIVYSLFYIAYMLLAHYSRDSRKVIFMAASISIFFMALFVSSVVMVL